MRRKSVVFKNIYDVIAEISCSAVLDWKRLQKYGVRVDRNGNIVAWPKGRKMIHQMSRTCAQRLVVDFLCKEFPRLATKFLGMNGDAVISRLGLPNLSEKYVG